MSQLNKQFSDRDLQRMRNIVTGNTANNTRIQAGYINKKIQYIEGDVWEEDGKTWTIKNSIKQTITKHDTLKSMFEFPLTCPNCNKPMKNHSLNKKMFSIHKKCSNCVIEIETKLKIEGKYEEYEKNLLNANKNSSLNDTESMFEDFINNPHNQYITENGDIEKWSGGGITPELIKIVKDNIKRLRETEL